MRRQSVYYYRKPSPIKGIIALVFLALLAGAVYWYYINYYKNSGPITSSEVLDERKESSSLATEMKATEVVGELKSSGKILPSGAIIAGGDTVMTGKNSRAVISLGEKDSIRLGAETEVTLTQKESFLEVLQKSGRSYHVVSQIPQSVQTLDGTVTIMSGETDVITSAQTNRVIVITLSGETKVEVVQNDKFVAGASVSPLERADVRLDESKASMFTFTALTEEGLTKDEWFVWNASIGKTESPEEMADQEMNLLSSVDKKSVSLKWNAFEGSTFTDYRIKRASTRAGIVSTQAIKVITNQSGTSYTDAVSDAGDYFYQLCVTRIDDDPICSSVIEVSIAPEEEASENLTPAPVTLSAPALSIQRGERGVVLSWSRNMEETFKEYKIVRSSTNALPSYPNDILLGVSQRGSEQFIDESVLPDMAGIYYYRVCSVSVSDGVFCGNVASVGQ